VSTFAFPMEAPHPQLILVHIPVVRHSWFYVTRFFVPLLLLVAIAYSIFWVKPEDLGSSAGIGITCMLSIIAFQLAQADTLPRVPYLTIADRIYTICYILIAVALGVRGARGLLGADGPRGPGRQRRPRRPQAVPAGVLAGVPGQLAVGLVRGERRRRRRVRAARGDKARR
jgi:hypothetical protein